MGCKKKKKIQRLVGTMALNTKNGFWGGQLKPKGEGVVTRGTVGGGGGGGMFLYDRA